MYQEPKTTTSTFSSQEVDKNENLSSTIISALIKISNIPKEYLQITTLPISGIGENSYGLILRVNLRSSDDVNAKYNYILKIAPKNSARRSHMRVADYYAREVFMYKDVFQAYRNLILDLNVDHVDLVPKMEHYSLEECNEFIIFEDLTQLNYVVGQRTHLPDYDMVAMALRTLGKFHGLSFALQAKKSNDFGIIIEQLKADNLFTPDIEPISIEFGKSYIRLAMNMIDAETSSDINALHIEALKNIEENFKEICLYCVDGFACAPYAVICHGDFWNNNILNKYSHNNTITSTKLIDFQMSRYASPVLDLVHYLFVCTSNELREKHLLSLLYDVYYVALSEQLQVFKLNISSIYPREIFERQLIDYGVYGICMAAFSLPFFVADMHELPDLDKVCEVIKIIGKEAEATKTQTTQSKDTKNDQDLNKSRLKLIEEDFKLLTPRTSKIFKLRMSGIVADIVKYGIKTQIES